MNETADLAIVGAGPAGLAAASVAADSGVDVALIDDQPAVGGQIYRAIETAGAARQAILGSDYARGAALAAVIGRPGVRHLAGATVWQVTRTRKIYFTREGRGRSLAAKHVILATGAMERPMPFPGWTLPGVMTAGAGQILLKSSGLVPEGPVVLAGSGPLLYLLAAQYLRAGAGIAAIVETTPRANYPRALPHLPSALGASSDLRKGLGLLREIRRHGVPHYKGATDLSVLGEEGVMSLSFSASGRSHEIACALLLIHQGVVPNVQITRALGLVHDWDEAGRCWRPRLGSCGETEAEGISVGGDGGGIGGAEAAEHQGRLAGLDVARRLGSIDEAQFEEKSRPVRRQLRRALRIRPFLDALYAPARAFLSPGGETLVCRCEEVTAAAIREYVRLGCLGPNQTKAFGRPGMGPCQGRFCGLTVSEIIAEARGMPVSEVGYYRIRFPIKPVMLGEIAAIGDGTRE